MIFGLLSTSTIAQEVSGVKVDDFLRISLKDSLKFRNNDLLQIRGYFAGSDKGNLMLRHDPDKEFRIYALSQLTKIELYQGKKTQMKLGFFIGFVTGYLSTFLVLADSEAPLDGEDVYLRLGPAFGLLGGFLGGVIGDMIISEKWEKVPLDRFKGGFKSPGRYYPIIRFQFPLRK